uniref:ATP-dependent DNA helicase n=1 Tax=Lactuca sativa TaxID=4236 RepID=A0A9R1XPL5_LACSA|nr:hypothetical protein LSAT_V11C200082770 [Lactuca sativa]
MKYIRIHLNLLNLSKFVKYLFKYVYKGHDKQVIHIDKDQENIVINEIRKFQDARYLSSFTNPPLCDGLANASPESTIEWKTLLIGRKDNEEVIVSDYDLPNVSAHIDIQSRGYREVLTCARLSQHQKFAYDEIMRHVDENISGVFFIDGPGGTGKTFLYKVLLANIHASGLIALTTATSSVVANNMSRGTTTHSRFGIPLNLDNNSMCKITKQSGKAQLLREAKVIIWDEAAMAKRQAVETVDRTMQDIADEKLPFGGKIMVIQVLLVVRRGTRAQIVDSSLRMSPLWASIKRLRIKYQHESGNDPWFFDFLLRVGDGKEETLDETFIHILDNMFIPYIDETTSVNALIDAIFPSLQSNGTDSKFIISRAILSTKNESVDKINNKLIERFSCEQKVYYMVYPLHYLRLKTGCPIILFNGTRLICRALQQNVFDAEIIVGQHAGKRVFLPKISLCSSDDEIFPFKLKRKQFPIQLRQTIPNVGVYLPESVFSHGQLYVALSREISRDNTNVLVKPEKTFDNDGIYISNVVYKEVLCD